MEAEEMMKRTYNCAVGQLQLVKTLDQLRYRKLLTGKEVQNLSDEMKLLIEYIEMIISLTPTSYHHDSHKITFLKRAVAD